MPIPLHKFDNLIADLIEDSHNTALMWQVGALVGCALAGWLAMRLLRPYLRLDIGWETSRAGARRIGFPLLMLAAVWLAREGVERSVGETHLLDIALPLLLSLVIARLLVFSLRYAFKPSETQRFWERNLVWLIWGAFAAHISGLVPHIHTALEAVSFEAGNRHFSLWLLMQAAAVIAIAIISSLGVAQFFENRLMGVSQMNLSLRMALVKGTRTLLLLFAVMVALPAVGIDLTVLSVFGGALGVGLGIGLQKIASNYISGFIILLDRSIRIDDLITVDSKYGQVTQINTRYTLLKAQDGTESIVPNEMLITQTVINHSLTRPDIRITVPVQVGYDTDLDAAREIMLEVARAHHRVLHASDQDEPKVLLKSFGDNGIQLELGVWINDPSEGQQNLRSDINWELWRRFRAAGIEMPFPQRVVHLVADKDVAQEAANKDSV
jgi:small-conductance mechanosensitive channel